MGVLNEGNSTNEANLNAINTNLLIWEKNNIASVSTLVPSHQTNHVISNSSDEQNISMAEINVQPTNIRSWKRIMRLSNLNGATDTLELEKKRKASMCMAPTTDFPCKRMQMLEDEVSSVWWRLWCSPTKSHKSHNVELLRAWEPSDKEGAW